MQTFRGAQESIPPAYGAWGAGTSKRVVVPARQAENRFLGSLKGLQIRAQCSSAGTKQSMGAGEPSCRTGPLAHVAWRAGKTTRFLLGS